MDPRSLALPLVAMAGLVGLTLVAGCTGDPLRDQAVNATFEANASGDQLDDLVERLRQWGPNLTVAATEPVVVVISDLAASDCEEVREMLQARAYITQVGTCQATERVMADTTQR